MTMGRPKGVKDKKKRKTRSDAKLDFTKIPHKVEFETLLSVQCTLQECAGHFGVDKNTVVSAFKRAHGEHVTWTDMQERFGASGRISLRRAQFQMATEKNNAIMAIWLGKQWLGQVDHKQIENLDTPVTIVYKDSKTGKETKAKIPTPTDVNQ